MTLNVAVDLAVEARLAPRREGYLLRHRGGEEHSAADLAALGALPGGELAALVAGELELPALDVELASESPRGGGLGASSALTVALLAAGQVLAGRPALPPSALAALARDLEARLMSLPTGTQDHYPALLGGALAVHHRPGGERVERLDADLGALGESLLVAYTGQSHFSAGANWLIVRRRLDADPEIRDRLAGICEVAAQAVEALAAGDLPRLGGLMSREWELRRGLSEEVSTPVIEELLARAGAEGAWGGKACGAGGGGCVALLCPPARRASIARRLEAAGARVLAARPTEEPLQVTGSRAP